MTNEQWEPQKQDKEEYIFLWEDLFLRSPEQEASNAVKRSFAKNYQKKEKMMMIDNSVLAQNMSQADKNTSSRIDEPANQSSNDIRQRQEFRREFVMKASMEFFDVETYAESVIEVSKKFEAFIFGDWENNEKV